MKRHPEVRALLSRRRAPKEDPMLKTAGAAIGALIAILFLAGIATHLTPHTPQDAPVASSSR
jgi:hypothetical protein